MALRRPNFQLTGLADSRQTPIRMAEFKSAYGPKYALSSPTRSAMHRLSNDCES